MAWWDVRAGQIIGATLLNVDLVGHSQWAKYVDPNDAEWLRNKAAKRAELGARLDAKLRFHQFPLVSWLGDGGFFAAPELLPIRQIHSIAGKVRRTFESWISEGRDDESGRLRRGMELRMVMSYEPQLVVDSVPGSWYGTEMNWLLKNERGLVGKDEQRLILTQSLHDMLAKDPELASFVLERLERTIDGESLPVWALGSEPPPRG
jgi:hypothetical protein